MNNLQKPETENLSYHVHKKDRAQIRKLVTDNMHLRELNEINEQQVLALQETANAAMTYAHKITLEYTLVVCAFVVGVALGSLL